MTSTTEIRSPSARKWAATALIAGILATVAGAGTFASFNASTLNPDNVFSTGRIELSNTKTGGTACLSGHSGTGSGTPAANLDGNGNDACDALIDLALRRPGDTAQGRLALANTGDYDGLLQFWLNGCTSSAVTTPSGSGDLCTKLEVYIQEFDSSYTTATSSCVFPSSAGSACSTTWAGAGDTLADLAAAATPTAPMPTAAIDLAKTATTYLQVSLRFADGGFDADGNGVDNQYQNRMASFDLTWRLQEA